MADFRLYKDIYRVNHFTSGETYTLLNAFSITALVINRSSSALIENVTVSNESTGVYYAVLNPYLYSYDQIYEVLWSVKYTSAAPIRILKSRFRFQPYNIIADILYDIGNPPFIEYLIDDSQEIIIEINSSN